MIHDMFCSREGILGKGGSDGIRNGNGMVIYPLCIMKPFIYIFDEWRSFAFIRMYLCCCFEVVDIPSHKLSGFKPKVKTLRQMFA